jgi:hypothetical protein
VITKELLEQPSVMVQTSGFSVVQYMSLGERCARSLVEEAHDIDSLFRADRQLSEWRDTAPQHEDWAGKTFCDKHGFPVVV